MHYRRKWIFIVSGRPRPQIDNLAQSVYDGYDLRVRAALTAAGASNIITSGRVMVKARADGTYEVYPRVVFEFDGLTIDQADVAFDSVVTDALAEIEAGVNTGGFTIHQIYFSKTDFDGWVAGYPDGTVSSRQETQRA